MNKPAVINELERKLLEFQDQPGFLLGLDGWILRSVPLTQRSKFLAAYEKALQIAHHPDLYEKAEDKQRHEKYLQAVSKAIGFMNSDVFAYELATEDVPTKQNHFLRIQERLSAKEGEIRIVEDQLRVKGENYDKLLSEKTQLEKDIKKLETAALCAVPMSRLKEYQDWQLRSMNVTSINHSGNLFIRGVKMKGSFGEKEIHQEVPTNEDSFATINKKFSRQIRKNYLTNEQMLLKLNNGKQDYRSHRARVIGGMPAVAIKEFFNYQSAKATNELGGDIAKLLFSKVRVTFASRAELDADLSYEERITPFTTPYFTQDMPVLVKFEQLQNNGWAKYDLVYVQTITDRNKK